MLGILIREVTDQFYGDFLQNHIFQHLWMTTARMIGESDIVLNRDELTNQEWVPPTTNTFADGVLYLNIYDMVKWETALNGNKLLKHQASFDQI